MCSVLEPDPADGRDGRHDLSSAGPQHRALIGDDRLLEIAPTLMADGVPCGALTTLAYEDARWTVVTDAFTLHLPTSTTTRPGEDR